MKRFKTPKAVTTLILTLITIFFWAGFEVYRSFTVKPSPTVPEVIINPINPVLDTNSLNSIKQRIFLDDNQIGNTAPTASPTLSPTPIPTSSPTATPTITATPSAIPSATP